MTEENLIMDQLRLHWAACDKLIARMTAISLARIRAEEAGLPSPPVNEFLTVQVKPVDEDKERAAFEAWFSSYEGYPGAWAAWLERASRG